MPVPKRKKSRARVRMRRANWLRMSKPTYAACARCKSPVRPHHACTVCGYYAGRQVVEVEE